MRHREIVAASLAIGLSGCVPMEQAALTYTSKTTMGVGMAGGTQETPGLEVAIGFKEANIALVPVAVAKYCYKAKKALCQNDIYRMKMVVGNKIDAVESLPIQNRIDEINRELEQSVNEQKRDTDRLSQLNAMIALTKAADAADAALKNIPDAVAGESPDVTRDRAEQEATAKLRPVNFDAAKARDEIARLDGVQIARTARRGELQKELASLTPRINANSSRGRTDAYSVYGKFSGAASGNGQGANLTAGKVFATGIAAQNLTEFATTTECLGKVHDMAEMIPSEKADERIALLASAGKICGRAD